MRSLVRGKLVAVAVVSVLLKQPQQLAAAEARKLMKRALAHMLMKRALKIFSGSVLVLEGKMVLMSIVRNEPKWKLVF